MATTREEFKQYVIDKYEATITPEGNLKLNFKTIFPSSFLKIDSPSNSLIIYLKSRNWAPGVYANSLDLVCNTTSIPALNETLPKIKQIWRLNENEMDITVDYLNSLLSNTKVSIYKEYFVIRMENDSFSLRLIEKGAKVKLEYNLSYELVNATTFGIPKFEKFMEKTKEALKGDWLNNSDLIADLNTIKNFDLNPSKEWINVKVSDLPEVPEKRIEARPLKQEQIETATDFLLEHFKDELIINKLAPILDYDVLSNALDEDGKSFSYWYLTNFSFWYSFCLDELNIDIYNSGEFAKKDYWSSRGKLSLWEYTRFDYTPKSGKIFVSKKAFDYIVHEWTNFMPYGALIEFGEGITNLDGVRFSSGTYILPTTLTGNLILHELYYESTDDILIKFKPIKNENGELISPFKINIREFEMYKNRFKAV